MDLLSRVAVLAVIIIIIAGLIFLFIKQNFGNTLCKPPLSSDRAVQCVLSDLEASNPSANISVVDVSQSKISNSSWNIVLSVVYNGTKPCPTLFIEAFDYPATGLVPSVDNLYTRNCIIFGLPSESPYFNSSRSPYIAIVRSYNQSNPSITNYVSAHGYDNVIVHAKFYSYLDLNTTHLGKQYYNVWLINYSATNAQDSDFVVMDSSGVIVGNYTK